MPGDLDSELVNVLLSCKEQVVLLCVQNLESVQPYDDYHELLELVIIVFGGYPYSFGQAPCTMSHGWNT